MIKIFTDSTSYIPTDIQIEYDINVLPVKFEIDSRLVAENEISNESFYGYLNKEGKVPPFYPIETQVIYDAFDKELEQKNTIIAIFQSAALSDSYKNACAAKKKLMEKYAKANITLIDSKSSCMQEGLIALTVAESVKKGAWLEEAIRIAEEAITYTRLFLIPKDMKYFEISGRLKKSMRIIGGALQLFPIIASKGGEVDLFEMVQGKSQKRFPRVYGILQEDIKKYGIDKIFVSHIDNFDEAMEVARAIEEFARIEVSITDIGPVIGAELGPGTIAIIYKTMNPMPVPQ